LKSIISICLILGIFAGCGYKPTSYYARDAIRGDVYVKLNMDIENSENSIYIKDAINKMIMNQFKTPLNDDKAQAETFVHITLNNVTHSVMSTDNDGYAKSYRTYITILLTYQKRDQKINTIKVSDYYDYSVDEDSVITDEKRSVAVKAAAQKALSDIFSKIAIQNMRK